MNKAIIAMSGGVDSGIAAYLMSKRGFNCIGATMRLYEENNSDFEAPCCTSEDIKDAKAVADSLGIPYYVFDFKTDFKEKVIDKFILTYENGGTPNPCIDCNRYLKFKRMLDKMYELSCDYVVTGHYARIEEKDGWYYLKKGIDMSKDQSYVLYSLTQEQLSHTIFPLGEYSKEEIRRLADEQGFSNAHKKDSQDICFVPDGDYAAFIERYCGKTYPQGNFVDKNGKALGVHKGIIKYTNGQRKGLGIALGKPAYVIGKNINNNTVIIGDNEDLFSTELIAEDFNWLIPDVSDVIKCKARVRYNMTEQSATAYRLDDGNVKVIFDMPQRAITKGQAVVMYDNDTVLGGGTII